MGKIKIGLQIHSVREAFSENPMETLKSVAKMGYQGVEFTVAQLTREPQIYKTALVECGLECFGLLTGWADVQPTRLVNTIKLNREIGSPFIVIGSVPSELAATSDEVKAIVSYMNELNQTIHAEGFITGYHNHSSDLFNVIDGKPFFDHVFDNTNQSFVMLLDTGNALEAGYETIPLIHKYAHRSQFLHIKGYSKTKGYLAYIGEDDFNWPDVIKCCVELGDAESFSIEFGARGNYDPFERAKTSLARVKAYIENL